MPPVETVAATPWVPVLVAVIAFLGVIAVPLIGALLANHNARQAALAAAEVARLLKETSERTDNKLDAIYKLSDGRLSEALKKINRLEQRAFEVEGTVPTGEPPPTPRPKDLP